MTDRIEERLETIPANRPGVRLLTCGIAAGVVYVGLGVAQFLFRDGLDIRRHQLSVATNGTFGWIQTVNFVLCGVLTIAAAEGMRRVLTSGQGSRWAPRLIGTYGAGLIGAGVFHADPLNEFPPGTPDGPPESVSWHAGVHLVAASLGFIALAAACFVLARRFWRVYSVATGLALLVAWFALGMASDQAVASVVFVVTALHAGIWVAAVSARLRSSAGHDA